MEDKGTMMVSEPVAGYTTVTYADVMEYIHSGHVSREDKQRLKSRLTVEIEGRNLDRAYKRLDHLSTLRRDWDGDGALPISPRVIKNVKDVLLISEDADWANWLIGPDSNATLGLQSKVTNACISLGSREYSYYARINGTRYGESHVDFTPESFLKTMREIG